MSGDGTEHERGDGDGTRGRPAADADDAGEGDGDPDWFMRGIAAVVLGLVLFSLLVVVLAPSETPRRGTDPPPVDWSFEQVNDSHLRITHAGGPPLDAQNVSVAVGQVDRRSESLSWNGTIGRNDSTVVSARGDQVVEVFWLGRHRTHHQMARRVQGQI